MLNKFSLKLLYKYAQKPVVLMLAFPAPAIILGILIMHFKGISMLIWIQNVVGLIFGAALGFLILSIPSRNASQKIIRLGIPLSLLLLLFTFFDPGIQGVHRWAHFGPIGFHAASIVLPFLLVALGDLLKYQNWWISAFASFGITIMLACQPDASQTTSFVIAALVILLYSAGVKLLRWCFAILLLLPAIISWIYLDPLPPVTHVEGIVILGAKLGGLWLIGSIITLVLLPLPFLILSPKSLRPLSLGLGIYFTSTLVTTIFGNFPIPLMGYGISPILGYFIALAWLLKLKRENERNF